MKILRNSALLLLGFSLSVPAAFACDHFSPPSNEWFHHICHPGEPEGDIEHSDRDCDHNGRNSGRGNDCDHGRGGGTTDTGGTGDTTNPPSPKS
jgi:hypothetical protein